MSQKQQIESFLKRKERYINICAGCTVATIATIVVAMATAVITAVKHPEMLFTTLPDFVPFEEAAPEAWSFVAGLIAIGFATALITQLSKFMVFIYHKRILALRKEIKGRR